MSCGCHGLLIISLKNINKNYSVLIKNINHMHNIARHAGLNLHSQKLTKAFRLLFVLGNVSPDDFLLNFEFVSSATTI